MRHIPIKAGHNVTKARVITVISLEMKHLCIKLALVEARATMLLIWWSNLSDLSTKIPRSLTTSTWTTGTDSM